MSGISVRRYRFTLIELLVVVAIITVLAAMLLPSLTKARNLAMSVNCLSNLRQNATAMLSYANDFDGEPPAAQANDNPAWVARQFAEFSADGKLDGWGVTHSLRYIGTEGLRCPGKAKVPAGRNFGAQSYGWTHYNYRWNSTFSASAADSVTVKRPVRVLDARAYAETVMLADDASFGTNWGGTYPGTFAAEVAAWRVNGEYWGHRDAGNAVRHDGSGKRVKNFNKFVTSGISADGYPNYYLGWPCQYYWSFPSWTILDAEASR